MAKEETTGTVIVAFTANLSIAVAKFIAGFMTGSSAMLSEGAHSVADTMNQVFLFTSIKLGGRPPDERHPFGYGKERYFWVFLAAVGIFVAGAIFSIFEGIEKIRGGTGQEGGYLAAYIVLAIAVVMEGTSWTRAVRQIRGEALRARFRFFTYVFKRADPTVKTVAYEDSAALIGLILAFLGVGLHQLTGSPVYDGAASITIGIVLIVTAYLLGRDTKALLVGQAAAPELARGIRTEIASADGIDSVVELLTMQLGPESVLVAARVDLGTRLGSDEIERLAERIDRRLRERFPEVRHVFLDPTAHLRREVAVEPRGPGEHEA